MKLDDMTAQFRTAMQHEELHLQRVRSWYLQSVTSQLMGKSSLQ
jgi:hypothetical protein